jgi:hypothetical protein
MLRLKKNFLSQDFSPNKKKAVEEDAIPSLPSDKDALFVGVLERKSIDAKGIVWTERLVMLTEEICYFATIDRTVLDFIFEKDMTEYDLVEDEDLQKKGMMEVVFRTVPASRNCGRSYIFRATEENAHEWEDVADPCFERAQQRAHQEYMQEKYGHSWFEMTRAKRKIMIQSNGWQYILAIIILLGFACDVLTAQVLPQPQSREKMIFFALDIVVSGFFTIDLCINMFANSSDWFRPFYTEPANAFDMLIVAVSLANLYMEVSEIQSPPVKMIRLIRVVKDILFTVTLIYSVLGVSFFAEISRAKFLDLKTALFTMNGVSTGDLSVAYELFETDKDGVPVTNALIAFFFITYILIGTVLLLNVVIAVLLDEFIANVVRETDAAEEVTETIRAKRRITGVLDYI